MREKLFYSLIVVLVCPLMAIGYSIDDAEEDLRNLQFESVLQQLDAELFFDIDDKSYAYYLLSTAAYQLKDYEKAIEYCNQTPLESKWFVKALYRKADSMLNLQRYDEAEAIYAAGAEGLLSEKRRVEIASIYIKHADHFFKPLKKDENPDYARARTLYQRALEILSPNQQWERATYQVAMTHFHQGQWDEAQKQFQSLIDHYQNDSDKKSTSPEDEEEQEKTEEIPNPYPRGGYLDSALFHRGEAFLKMGNQVEARRIWKKLVDSRKDKSTQPKIIANAAFHIAKTYNFPTPSDDKSLALGLRYHNEFITSYPDHEKVPEAVIDKAGAYQHRRQFQKAFDEYQTLIERYEQQATPKQKAQAEYHSARCLMELGKYEDAISAFESFLLNYPGDENWSNAQQSIVHTRYRKAESAQQEAERELQRWQRKMAFEKKDIEKESIPANIVQLFQHARERWEAFQKQYPLDSRIPDIMLRLAFNLEKIRKFDEAIQAWREIVSRYPNSNQASHALFAIAETTRKELKDFKKALDLYKDVTFGPYQQAAQEQIARLKETYLALRTERVFLTNQKPVIAVSTRNIESYECKLYPLDLAAYHQTQHTIRDIEQLDINLIAPEQVWNVTPGGYKPYHQINEDLPIPVKKAGAWIVKVQSDTLEAMTLVLVSDIAVAIQGGKKEVFAYVENQRLEKPASDVDVFISDGQRYIAQGKTNGDGVMHLKDLDATEANRLSVFASHDGHWGGDILNINNLNVATSLQPRIYITTDRMTYQPGDKIHYRAIIREIKDGRYTIPDEHKYDVTILDTRSTPLLKRTVSLNEFGTLNGTFDLNPAAPMGQYRIMISRKDGPSSSWNFNVQHFTLPTMRFEIETSQLTYYYGDEISGTIRLTDFSGNPIANEPITYSAVGPFPNETREGITDKKGEVEFEFESWDFPEQGQIAIQALAKNRQVNQSKTLVMVNTGFYISLNTTRNIYLAEEPFQVEIAAKQRDEEQSAIKRELTVSLQKQNFEGVFETVDSQSVTTSESSKKPVTLTFKAKDGGQYRLLAEGVDSRDTKITSEKRLHISDENDTNKLLILNDQSRFQQGETATFVVVSRLEENLCLITGEREGVVDYRLQRLKEGKNEITWQLDDQYSPQALISIMVMDDNQFYHRNVSFVVHRGLDISITANAEEYSPRDEAEFVIQTKNQNGKPVSAECSLGLVDAAFLALFPDSQTPVDRFFDQAARGRFTNVSSSAGFSYEGVSHEINRDLIAHLFVEEDDYLSDEDISRDLGLRAGAAIRKKAEVQRLMEREEFARKEMAAASTAKRRARGAEQAKSLQLAPAREPASRPMNAPADSKAYFSQNGIQSVLSDKEAKDFARLSGINDSISSLETVNFADASYSFTGGGYGMMGGMGGRASVAMGEVPVLGKLFLPGGPAHVAQNNIIVRANFTKTAYYNPIVITNEDGRATIKVDLPDNLTSWVVNSKAITKDTLVNQTKTKIVVDKPFRLELEKPTFLTEGDEATGLAIAKNMSENDQTAEFEFIQSGEGETQKSTWTSSIAAGDIYSHSINLKAEKAGEYKLTLKGRAKGLQDGLEETINVSPWGIPIRAGASGIAQQSLVEEISLPAKANYSNLRMWLELSGTRDVSLLQAAWSDVIPLNSSRSQIEKGLAAISALEFAEYSGHTDQIPIQVLREKIDAAVQHVLSTQKSDGFWTWGGNAQNNLDLLTTARALELLQKAKPLGVQVPQKVIELSVSHLMERYQQTLDESEKTRILYAISNAQSPDFSFVNRIHRSLAQLDPFDAAWLGLTWMNMDRKEKAMEIVDQFIPYIMNGEVSTTEKRSALNRIPPSGRQETIACFARLYFQLPASIHKDEVTKHLLDELVWQPLNSRMWHATSLGSRIQALAAFLKSVAGEDQSFTLQVKLNGETIIDKKVSQSALDYQQIKIDPQHIKAQDNRVEFTFNGKGDYRYNVVLEGWTKQDVKPQDWMEVQDRFITHVSRDYEHGYLMYDHQRINRGYGVVEGSVPGVQNTLKEVKPGDRINVELTIRGADVLDYLVVEEHLPAGCVLVTDSINGPVDHFVMKNDAFIMYLRGPQRYYHIRYQLQARYSGSYRARPTFVSPMNAPEQLYTSSSNTIIVLEEDKEPSEKYNLTPDEFFYLGERHFNDGHYDEARRLLTELINTYPLRPEPYLKTAKMLFKIHLNDGDPNELVRYFEIIKERDKGFEVQFDQISQLAHAYRSIGEYERAVYVYRSLLAGLFLQEGAVSGTLQGVNKYREALDYMKQLIREYPDIPSVQTAVYSAGSIIYQNVDQWAKEEAFIKSGMTKKALLADAVGMIESFLALYPTNPVADEAGYTLINLWLDQNNHEMVSRLSQTFAERYPKSTYLDSFDYLTAYALFQQETYQMALEYAQKVASEDYPAPGGGLRKSDDVNTAVLMAGKILHAAGELEKALDEYEKVKQSFSDANMSIDYLTEKGIRLEDVVMLNNNEPSKLTLKSKNVKEANVRVYKVDLMTFYLLERDLEEMTNINLAGITPTYDSTHTFDKAKPFNWNETELNLPINDPGAYLVVMTGQDVAASSMLIRSNLSLEVQEEVQQGAVRVNVRVGKPPEFAKNVKVKVRGTQNDQFVSGVTDLRGVFNATGIRGESIVMAQLGDQYGFYRGTKVLGAVEKQVKERYDESKTQVEFDALGNNYDRLQQTQQRQNVRWNKVTDPTNNRLFTQQADVLY